MIEGFGMITALGMRVGRSAGTVGVAFCRIALNFRCRGRLWIGSRTGGTR